MKLPHKIKVLVITLSDRAFRGEYSDQSGPRLIELTGEMLISLKLEYEIESCLLPDDESMLREKLQSGAKLNHVIFTTGGTGIGPRDITVDVVRPMLDRELPGIMEFIRMKFGSVKRNALLSRSVAGIIGTCLVYTLPGSVNAVNEYMSEISLTFSHTLKMLYGENDHH